MLSVLSIGFSLAPVGPDAVGGAEQVLSMLDEALVNQGHRSVVVAAKGSTVHGVAFETPLPAPPYDETARHLARRAHAANVERALDSSHFDVVHLHGIDFADYLPPAGIAALVTVHLPIDSYPTGALDLLHPNTYLHGVSETHQSTVAAASRAPLLPPIQNGIRVERFRFERCKGGPAVALGRICPEKGYHLALDAARRAGIDLVLAGTVFPYRSHQQYFEHEIIPRLDERRRYVGPLGFAHKVALLGRARCLLVPSLIAETSSLVAMEALACGTPVIAFRSGALPEIVEHGRTGFIVDDIVSLAAAIAACREIDPEACREAAERRFDAARCAQRYFEVYRMLKERHSKEGPRS